MRTVLPTAITGVLRRSGPSGFSVGVGYRGSAKQHREFAFSFYDNQPARPVTLPWEQKNLAVNFPFSF